jgi:hypothetical protein
MKIPCCRRITVLRFRVSESGFLIIQIPKREKARRERKKICVGRRHNFEYSPNATKARITFEGIYQATKIWDCGVDSREL